MPDPVSLSQLGAERGRLFYRGHQKKPWPTHLQGGSPLPLNTPQDVAPAGQANSTTGEMALERKPHALEQQG